MVEDNAPFEPDFTLLEMPDGPPARWPVRELAAVVAPARLAMRVRALDRAPRGDGHAVIAVPGFKFADGSSLPLRRYLARLGYAPHGWGLGTNLGTPEEDAARLAPVVEALAERAGPVSLVGWSLGGVIAREVARTMPDRVRSVVMYGTPVVGGPNHTIARGMFDPVKAGETAARLAQLDRESPVGVPVTSIYSRSDRVVNWLACIDRWTPGARNVQVRTAHMGMPFAPDVWLAVADALARTDHQIG